MTASKALVTLAAATALLAACSGATETTEDMTENTALASREAKADSAPVKPADSPQLTADLAVIDKSCRKMGNATDTLCACVVEEARKLSADELALSVAQLVGDAPRADAVRPKLDIMGLSRGGGFMTQAPYICEG